MYIFRYISVFITFSLRYEVTIFVCEFAYNTNFDIDVFRHLMCPNFPHSRLLNTRFTIHNLVINILKTWELFWLVKQKLNRCCWCCFWNCQEKDVRYLNHWSITTLFLKNCLKNNLNRECDYLSLKTVRRVFRVYQILCFVRDDFRIAENKSA